MLSCLHTEWKKQTLNLLKTLNSLLKVSVPYTALAEVRSAM